MKTRVVLLGLLGAWACAESNVVEPELQLQKLSAAGELGADDADAGPRVWPPLSFGDIGKVRVISNKLKFAEGPVWDPQQQILYFSDITGRAIYSLTLPDQIDVVSKLQFAPDGLALDANGQLVLAGYAGRSIDRLANEGLQALANAYQGQALNSPDDLEVRTDGTIYFTDPTFGLNGTRGALGFQGVYRISPDGALSLEDKSKSDGPNGASLSPDESVLYVSFTNTGKVAKYAVHADGSLGARTAFASGVTMADSMCVDSGGNVYVASASGLAVLDATGKRLGTIPTSNQVPSNCAFGGPDQRTLFITARTALMSIANMPIPGIPGRS